MKAKHQRLVFIVIGICSIGLAVAIILFNFNDNLVFFYSPTDLKQIEISDKKIIRVGGLIKDSSVKKIDSLKTEFIITDNENELRIYYEGLLPNLFREGQGMVARGILNSENILIADNLLAKHDENYMPPEVAKSLKKANDNNQSEVK